MLLWLRPSRVGDHVEVQTGNGVAGIVRETGLFACRLETVAASGARLTCRLWARPHEIGRVQRGLIEEIGRCLATADKDLKLAQILRTVPGDADAQRFSGTDRRERHRVPA